MALHLFRPAEPVIGSSPPVGTWTRILLWRKLVAALARGHQLPLTSHQLRSLCMVLLGLVGLGVQVVLLFLLGEMLDLYVSAVELWAELARKHLEIELS